MFDIKIKTIIDGYHDMMETRADARVKNWLLMSSPFPTLFLIFLYILFVKKIGPAFMKNRKPFQLKKLMIAYNAFQSVFSAWLFYGAAVHGWFNGYSFRCQPIDYSDDPSSVWMLHITWWFYFSKFIEFADTVFFILRKKQSQVTNLHIIHHAIVPIFVWISTKYVGTGQYTMAGFLNAFVHIFMYGYYMLAAVGPSIRKYLWWKKYLTSLQLIQFMLVFIHTVNTLASDCDVHKGFAGIVLFQAILFYILFMNFYKKSYENGKVQKEKVEAPKPQVQKMQTEKRPSFIEYVTKQLFGMCVPDQSFLLSTSSTNMNNGKAYLNSETLTQRLQK